MLNTTESFAAAHKANLELLRSFTAKTLDNVEQLTSLSLKAAKESLDDVADASLTALSAGDAQALWAVPSGLLQPTAQKAGAYGRQVIDILAGAKSELDRVTAAQTAAAQASMKSAFEAAQAGLQALAAQATAAPTPPVPKTKRA